MLRILCIPNFYYCSEMSTGSWLNVTVDMWSVAAAADVDKTGIAEAEEDEEVPGT